MTDERQPLSVPLGKGLPLLEGTFLKRPNQFTLVVSYEGEEVIAAMADRGRLREVLVPGRTLLMEHRTEPTRKTAYQVLAARGDQGQLISLDTQLPNRLIAKALEQEAIDELPPYSSWRAEKRIGRSRFDFALELTNGEELIMEVKSVGRIYEDQVARFPDAPTSRGARHVKELMELAQQPQSVAALLFVIQGTGASHLEVDTAIDPAFHQVLLEAQEAGVVFLVRACPLNEAGLALGEAVELKL